MMHSRKMHTFRDTGGIDLAEQSSSAKNAERMLKREPRKNLLSGTTEWNRELGGYGRVDLPPPRRLLKRELRKKKACISESMHFSTMHHRRKKSLVDAFYPYLMLKPPKSEKKIIFFFRKKKLVFLKTLKG